MTASLKSALPPPFQAFDDPSAADLETVGGKGANLVKLTLGGFPVPPGFLVPTSLYRSFVRDNDLDGTIADAIGKLQSEGASPSDPQTLEDASRRIREAFASRASVDEEFSSSLVAAVELLNGDTSTAGPVAVRSSATAEDLPDLSFAGQQDTYLNVLGREALVKAVVDCWSSLWTARAIGYRTQNGIPHDDVALCVVVQCMVQSESSGVLFTANPLTGKRDEVAIDATLGFGEALVGGLVEPDHYDVAVGRENGDFEIVLKTLGSKAVQMRGTEGGGISEENVSDSAQIQAMSDEVILALARMAKAIEEHYSFPQDVEFGISPLGEIRILQTRPITSLYPLPPQLPPDQLRVLFGMHMHQQVIEPITPVGRSVIINMAAGMGSYLGTHDTREALYVSGERIWYNLTPILRNPRGRMALMSFISAIDPSTPSILEKTLEDPRLANRKRSKISWSLPFVVLTCLLPRVLRNWLWPEHAAKTTLTFFDDFFAEAAANILPTGNLAADFSTSLTSLQTTTRNLFPRTMFPICVPAVMAGMIPFAILRRLGNEVVEKTGDAKYERLTLELAKGLSNNVTTDMDLALWRLSQTVKNDPDSLQRFETLSASELAACYMEGSLTTVAQGAVSDFLALYGVRGLGEIDLGRQRWVEDPEQIMGTLKGYIKINDPKLAPVAVFERGVEESQSAAKELEAGVRTFLRFGWFKAVIVRWAVRRYRALGGLREFPKFMLIRTIGLQRAGLIRNGEQFKKLGWFSEKDDICFLSLSELNALATDMKGWTAGDAEPESLAPLRVLISERREARARELRRKRIPRVILSDGTTFYEGLRANQNAPDGAIIGEPVSPGAVEGVVRVALDPLGTDLKPGEILVCRATDPAWTPLFLAAHGLVTEIGGMLTHGSVVAREYGIPAVVGVHEATKRLKTGQRIRLDGSSGFIEMLE